MKTRSVIIVSVIFSAVILFSTSPSVRAAEGYESLKGIESVKILFDFRSANPKSAPVYLKLIFATYQDKALKKITDKPKVVVVFMGPAVKLLSTKRDGVSADESKAFDKISELIGEMSKAGIEFEVCLFAVKAFGGDPKNLVKGVKHVENGWISAFAYQAKGYALIPVY